MNDYGGGGGDDSTVTVAVALTVTVALTVKTRRVFVVINCFFVSYTYKANVSP